jgi:hypothetical protein
MTRSPGHVLGPGEMRNAHEISVEELEKNSFGKLGVNWKIMLQCIR